MSDTAEHDVALLALLHRSLVWLIAASIAFFMPSPAWFLVSLVNAASVVLMSVALRRPLVLLCLLPLALPPASALLPIDVFRSREGTIIFVAISCNVLPLLILARIATASLRAKGLSTCLIGKQLAPVPRPASVTSAAVVLLIAGTCAFGAALVLFSFGRSLGIKVHQRELWITLQLAAVGGVIGVLSAAAILRGMRWGRRLFVIGIPVANALKWVAVGFGPLSVIAVVGYFVVLGLLSSTAADRFFVAAQTEVDARSE